MPTQPTQQQRVALAKSKLMNQLGKTGVVLLKGVVSQEEYNKDLSGKKGLKVFDEMRRSDGTVRAALMVIKLPIMAANWRIQVPNDRPDTMAAAQVVEDSLFNRISFDDFLRQGLTFLDFGFSDFEQTYQLGNVDSKEFAVLQSLGFRKQASVQDWDVDGEFGMTQMLPNGQTVDIPGYKLVHFAYDQEGDNFEGISVLRAAYKHWYMKNTLYQVDAIKHEKQGLGILKIKTPTTAKEEDKATAREIAREQRANEEAYIEELEGFSFEFMDMKANTTTDIMPSVNHHNRQILQSVLAQFLDIGSEGSSGSYAAGVTQADMFVMSLDAIAKGIATDINDQLIKNICYINGFTDLPEYPKITYDRIGQDSMTAFSEALNKLFTSGAITPDPELEDYLRKFLHLPEMSDDMRERYDEIRALRKNPSQPTLPGQPPVDNTQASDAALLAAAKQMRDKLQKAANENA